MSETTRFPMVPGFSPATMKLIERLKSGKPGDEIADSELAKVAGKGVAPNEPGYSNLQSAIRYVTRTAGVAWQRVKDGGRVRCLNASELIGVADGRRHHVRRQARRAVLELGIASSRNGELPEAEKPKLNALAAQLGAIAAFGEARVTRRIEATPGQKWDFTKTLEAIG